MTIKKTIKVTQEFVDAVEDYRKARNRRSWTAALVDLASIGIYKISGIIPPVTGAWGGDRKSEFYRNQGEETLERLDVELLGLPPLADDDPA
jgi:hypothetical protein